MPLLPRLLVAAAGLMAGVPAVAQILNAVPKPLVGVNAETGPDGYEVCTVTAAFVLDDRGRGLIGGALYISALPTTVVFRASTLGAKRKEPHPVRPRAFRVASTADGKPFPLIAAPAKDDTQLLARVDVHDEKSLPAVQVLIDLAEGRVVQLLVQITEPSGEVRAYDLTLRVPDDTRSTFRRCVISVASIPGSAAGATTPP